jgi:uncharacterized membrane protein YkvA (DUF1232 family)
MDWIGGTLVVLAVVVGVWLALVAVIWLHRPSRHLAGAALRLLPDVLRMLRALVADPVTPRRERPCSSACFAWLASPIDLLPEFLPGIGPLDDIVVAAIVLRTSITTAWASSAPPNSSTRRVQPGAWSSPSWQRSPRWSETSLASASKKGCGWPSRRA